MTERTNCALGATFRGRDPKNEIALNPKALQQLMAKPPSTHGAPPTKFSSGFTHPDSHDNDGWRTTAEPTSRSRNEAQVKPETETGNFTEFQA